MPKIQIASDIHTELHKDGGRSFFEALDPSDVDILVLAGGVATFDTSEDFLACLSIACAKYPEVVFVPGNHDYYEGSVQQATDQFEMIRTKWKNLHVFSSGSVRMIGGRRFIGGTMWFPEDPLSKLYERHINDFSKIRNYTPWVYRKNLDFRRFLDTELRQGDIVVTHYLPSMFVIEEKWAASPLNRFFLSEETDRILRVKPALWIHGHSHSFCDKIVGETRIVRNPFGYMGEPSTYVDKFVVEV